MRTLINRTISQRPFTMDNLVRRLNDEIVPVIRRLREAVNVDLDNWLLVNMSNDPAQGSLNMGGYNLNNFYGKRGERVALTGGGSLTQILSYDTAVLPKDGPGLGADEALVVGAQILHWEQADPSTMVSCSVTTAIYSSGSALTLSRTLFTDLGGLHDDADVALTSSGTSLILQAQATTNDCYARGFLWYQPKEALT